MSEHPARPVSVDRARSLIDFGNPPGLLRHALGQALAQRESVRIAERLSAADAPGRDTEEAARAWVALGEALLAGGRIAASESLIFRTFAVESVHSRRWLGGEYPELEALTARMAAIERAAGLTPDQYWARGDAPDEHRRLSDEYDAALDVRFESALREFGLEPLATLWREDRGEYDRLREIGRRAIFARDDHLTAVRTAIPLYEREAAESAGAGAFYAATVMLGSAAEARLLERFLSSPVETAAALAATPRADRPRNADPLHWSLDHMLAVAEQAGWLGLVEDEKVGADVRSWLLSVRNTRNLLHPGRHVRDKPHVVIGHEEFTDARLGYAALCIVLSRSSSADAPAPAPETGA